MQFVQQVVDDLKLFGEREIEADFGSQFIDLETHRSRIKPPRHRQPLARRDRDDEHRRQQHDQHHSRRRQPRREMPPLFAFRQQPVVNGIEHDGKKHRQKQRQHKARHHAIKHRPHHRDDGEQHPKRKLSIHH